MWKEWGQSCEVCGVSYIIIWVGKADVKLTRRNELTMDGLRCYTTLRRRERGEGRGKGRWRERGEGGGRGGGDEREREGGKGRRGRRE